MPASKKTNLKQTKKVKPVIKRNVKSGLKEDFGLWKEGVKAGVDFIVPRTKEDLAMTVGFGAAGRALKPAGRAVGGITKAGKKFVNKVYRNMGK